MLIVKGIFGHNMVKSVSDDSNYEQEKGSMHLIGRNGTVADFCSFFSRLEVNVFTEIWNIIDHLHPLLNKQQKITKIYANLGKNLRLKFYIFEPNSTNSNALAVTIVICSSTGKPSLMS